MYYKNKYNYEYLMLLRYNTSVFCYYFFPTTLPQSFLFLSFWFH